MPTDPTPNADLAPAVLAERARAGDAEAMAHLGNRLIDGHGLPPDPAAGRRWLEASAEAGSALGMLALGQRLTEGLGLPAEPELGARWIAQAAGTAFPPAMEAHGARLLETGDAEGERWLEAAAEAGFAPAMTRLALRRGDMDLLRRAAERGHGRALGEWGLALWDSDPEKAARCLADALRRGELHYGLVLGVRRYEAGQFETAAAIFQACRRMGAVSADVNIATMKRRGEWPEGREAPEAEALLAPLVEAGNPWAIVNMALLREADAAQLLAGLSDDAVAEVTPWWRGLAERGDPEGERVLTWLAARGSGEG